MSDHRTDFFEVLDSIFTKQRSLIERYRMMESLPEPPISLHTRHGQAVLKDFAWRVTEELAEAFDRLMGQGDADIQMHECKEELADANHFFVELLIFAGVTPGMVTRITGDDGWPKHRAPGGLDFEQLEAKFWLVTWKLGCAMNLLRNRPWKRTNEPTDEGKFRHYIIHAYTEFCTLWGELGGTLPSFYDYYFAKHNINKERISNGY
jgi:hypothetical protein